MRKTSTTILALAIFTVCFVLVPNPLLAKSPSYTIKLGHHSVDFDKYPADPPVVNSLVFKSIVESMTDGDIEVKV